MQIPSPSLKLIKNTSFIFVLAMALGLAYPGPSHSMEPLIAPALVMMMTFALTEIDLSTRGDLPRALAGMALNYLLLSGLILDMASFLDDEALWNGFVVMAAVPPAVAVLPMTRLLGGDAKLSLYSEALSYIISLIAMPLIILAFAGTSGVGFWYAFKASVTMVLVPIILSRFVKRLDRGLRVDPVTPINLGFFIVTYTVIGLNQSALGGFLAPVALIAFLRTFAIGSAVYLIANRLGIEHEKRISFMLFASYKNLGLAAAVAIVLFGARASMPAAICIFAENLFYIALYYLMHKMDSTSKSMRL